MMVLDMRITLPDSPELKPIENKVLDSYVKDQRAVAMRSIRENKEWWLSPEWENDGLIHLIESDRYFSYYIKIGFSGVGGPQSAPHILKEVTKEVTIDEWLDEYIEIYGI